MLVAMAGLPATGKSAVAAKLEEALPGFRLDKDEVREALFRSRVDYSGAQNDFCLETMFGVAGYLLARGESFVILDGRTYAKRAQVEALKAAAKGVAAPLRIIECVCSDETARHRLTQAEGQHLAQDRTFELYRRIKAQADSIPEPKLVLDTDKLTLEGSVEQALSYLRTSL